MGGESRSEGFRRKYLGPKEHLDCLKIDLNATEIIIVQDYARTNVNESTDILPHIYTHMLKLRIKQVIYESKI